ncbi:MAG: COG1361 S-layer family protein [archaeon]
MKKVILLIAMLLLSISMVSAIDATALSATLTRYDPQPAEPGQYVTVYIKLENSGTGTAKNLVLEILPEYPFSLDPGKSNKVYIGSLGNNYHTAEFTLKVDEKALQGTNKLKVRYNIDEFQKIWSEKELDITVQSGDNVFSISNIETEPTNIAPGSSGKIKVEVENFADIYFSDLSASIDLSSDDLPFAPYNSPTEKSFYQLAPNQKHEFVFNIITSPDAEAGIFKVPLTLTYSDNTGTEFTKTELIGVVVNSIPDITVTVDDTDLLSDNMMGTITLKIVNKGFNDVKFMNLKIKETDDFEILSASSEEYIGNLDSDDFETVEFNIMLKDGQELEIPLELEYKDMNNNPYTENLAVKLKVYSAKELGQSSSKAGIWFLLIIIVVVGYFIYKQRKKNKKK